MCSTRLLHFYLQTRIKRLKAPYSSKCVGNWSDSNLDLKTMIQRKPVFSLAVSKVLLLIMRARQI